MSLQPPIGTDAQETACGHTLFATALGTCGIAWGPGGIVAVQLPEANAQATQARLLRGLAPGTYGQAMPSALVCHAIAGIQALLAGQPLDLQELPLDMSRISAFHQQVYAVARDIPPGQTRTYGEVAELLGGKGLSRAVGQALGLNPFAPVVPCHRVLAAGDKPGGFSAGGGALTKMRMLQIEGAWLGGTRSLFGEAD
ncbi:methylated-DNA-[protein]-cysteine S-methyltransferase [Acidovorax sp. 69]|uniref:methylated-DNA--[protein]-cysteine S-methyltransferase n=1 Tax=Acidovorax sp. 69 TaxID=2035202 RepID=UPI000C2394F7|nr:methylated-DNA--[protein]-cysteine S-methyltransferase [Acidovorax sp. 69]PJI97263.1 methylated-DNA-[protein]-cysteine S-methyltransferase [Acidovorax sp. 69]